MERCEHCGAALEESVRTFQENDGDMHYELGEFLWMLIGQ